MANVNPWRMLPEVIQRDLSGPLLDQKRFGWDQGNFGIWFSKFYSVKVKPESVYPEWRFNCGPGLELPDQRKMLLCLYAKLWMEGFWNQIGTFDWFSLQAEMTFLPAQGEEALKKSLVQKRYTDAVGAKDAEDTWGLRSPEIGAQLHFRGPPTKDRTNKYCNVHLDLNNPGTIVDRGAVHYMMDKKLRKLTHNLQTVQAALKSQGVTVAALWSCP